MADEYAYAYLRESTVDRSSVLLSTSSGVEHPYFFDGFAERADIVAAALLVVGRVARTRFYTPPGMLAAILRAADPVVTSDGRNLRFESFSACCGVYCRLDLLPEGLDRLPLASEPPMWTSTRPCATRSRASAGSIRSGSRSAPTSCG